MNDNKRLWMAVKDNEDIYEIDMQTGLVRAHWTTTFKRSTSKNPVVCEHREVLAGTKAGSGYQQVRLGKAKKNGQRDSKFRYVHDLVAELAWELPVPQEYISKHVRKVQAYHIDGDKMNNAWWNLAWRVLIGNGEDTWYPERKMTKQFKKLLESNEGVQ